MTVGAEQILQGPEAEDDVLEVLLQRPQNHVLPQLVVQVRADQRKDAVETPFHRMHLLAHVAALGQLEPLAKEFQQAMQFRLALGHERDRQVELVGGEYGQVEDVVRAGFHDDLVDQMIAKRQPGDLLDERLVLRIEDVQLAADVLDVVLQEQDALRVAAVAGLELVEIEPFEQFLMDLQLQIGHDRAEMGLQFTAADGDGLLGLERERVGPDADLGAGIEDARLPAEHFFLADQAAIQADILQHQFAVTRSTGCPDPHHGMLPRD